MAEPKKVDLGDNWEIEDDVENFSSKEQQFSHQILIMQSLKKCVENGSVEMVMGRTEFKKDNQGNVSTKYIPDTRKQFIESVKTAKNFLKCDFDEEANKKINVLLEKIKTNKDLWLNREWSWWSNLGWEIQQKLILSNKGVIFGMHNQEHHFYNNSILEEIDLWREVLEELNELTKRLDFYEETMYVG